MKRRKNEDDDYVIDGKYKKKERAKLWSRQLAVVYFSFFYCYVDDESFHHTILSPLFRFAIV